MVNHYFMVKLNDLTHAERRLDGKTYREVQRRGSAAFVPHGCAHAVTYPQRLGALCLMTVAHRLVTDIAEQTGRRPELAPQAAVREDPFVLAIAREVVAEIEAGNPHGLLFAETMARTLALHIVRRGSGKPPSGEKTARIAPARLKWLFEYIEANLGAQLSVDCLASVAGLSPYHFCRAFKAETGTSPHRYVLAKRIESAAGLIKDRGVRLGDIAFAVGFADLSSFGKSFRRQFGMSPSRYRQLLK
jgi:AraC family transcriptional regulator